MAYMMLNLCVPYSTSRVSATYLQSVNLTHSPITPIEERNSVFYCSSEFWHIHSVEIWRLGGGVINLHVAGLHKVLRPRSYE